jgi:hypothetical protein
MGSIKFEPINDLRLPGALTGKSTEFSMRESLRLGLLCFCCALCILPHRPAEAGQILEHGKEGTIDQHGNIYVSSDDGMLIKVADTTHCGMAVFAPDRQTLGCMVMRNPKPDGSWSSLDLEIYLKGGRRIVIDPWTPIGEWHFWKDGQQVAICSLRPGRPIMHILYDSATGQEIEKVEDPPDESLLPQWAKNSLQLSNDSVPSSPALDQERTKWIVKILYRTEKIKPDMQRKDLLKLFTTEGGLSTPCRRTYVLIECPYIKVDVQFKAGSRESNEDLIESISKPYLAWGVMD